MFIALSMRNKITTNFRKNDVFYMYSFDISQIYSTFGSTDAINADLYNLNIYLLAELI